MQDQEAKLQQEILGDAREKAERVRQRAKHEAEKALAAARQALATQRAARLLEAQRTAQSRTLMIQASIEQEVRRAWLCAREQELEALFADALQAAESGGGGGDPVQSLRQLSVEALAALGPADAVVRVRPADRPVFSERFVAAVLAQALPGRDGAVRITVAEAPDQPAGIVVETADGRKRYDNTYRARLARRRDELRTVVAQAAARPGGS